MAHSARQANHPANSTSFPEAARTLCELGKNFYRRGWALGTSGNYSIVLERKPLLLAITASGMDKGAMIPDDILEMDGTGSVFRGKGKPSAEYLLHLAIVCHTQAGAILHTHSVWSTVLSERHAADGFLVIEGYEMLKGLAGVHTHQHRELVPILENSQDMGDLSLKVERMLRDNPQAHGFLLQGHGLYTWGVNAQEAKRHIEIFEFLLEVVGQR